MKRIVVTIRLRMNIETVKKDAIPIVCKTLSKFKYSPPSNRITRRATEAKYEVYGRSVSFENNLKPRKFIIGPMNIPKKIRRSISGIFRR